jgi:hypothetical protein
MFCPLRADVAQLVEQRFRKPQVTGSNPVVGCHAGVTRRRADLIRLALDALQGYGLASRFYGALLLRLHPCE